MDHLYFGTRSRRRARRRQVVIAAWLLGMVATVLGVPGADAAMGLFGRANGPRSLAASNVPGHGYQAPPAAALLQFNTVGPGLKRKLQHRMSRRVAARHHGTKPNPRPKSQPATVTPAASPSPPPPSTTTTTTTVPYTSVSGAIYAAAQSAGLDGAYLLGVARCESNLNVHAYNAAGYYGLFQFDQATWNAYGYGSIYDPVAQAQTAARLIAAGQTDRWPNCA